MKIKTLRKICAQLNRSGLARKQAGCLLVGFAENIAERLRLLGKFYQQSFGIIVIYVRPKPEATVSR
jgi:hypothetical protein